MHTVTFEGRVLIIDGGEVNKAFECDTCVSFAHQQRDLDEVRMSSVFFATILF